MLRTSEARVKLAVRLARKYGLIHIGSNAMWLNGIKTLVKDIDFYSRKPGVHAVIAENENGRIISEKDDRARIEVNNVVVDIDYPNALGLEYIASNFSDGVKINIDGLLFLKLYKIANFSVPRIYEEFSDRFYVPKQIVDVGLLVINGADIDRAIDVFEKFNLKDELYRLAFLHLSDEFHYGIALLSYIVGSVEKAYEVLEQITTRIKERFKLSQYI